jgi:hypothetical protein
LMTVYEGNKASSCFKSVAIVPLWSFPLRCNCFV